MDHKEIKNAIRPDTITVICVLNFILAVIFTLTLGILIVNPDWTGNTSTLNIIFFIIMDIAFIITIIYLWNMRKAGAFMYIAITLIFFIVMSIFAKGLSSAIINFIAFIPLAIMDAIILNHIKEMD
jgi:hypothetical protein